MSHQEVFYLCEVFNKIFSSILTLGNRDSINRRGDIPSAAVRIRPQSVRSADGQVKKPGRTADGQRTDNADGQRTDGGRMRTNGGRTMRTDSGRMRTDSGRMRTDGGRTADGQRTDGGRTSRSVRRPCANRAALLYYYCFDTFFTVFYICSFALVMFPSYRGHFALK